MIRAYIKKIFEKQPMNENYLVTFYFTSGETMQIVCKQKKLQNMQSALLKNPWHESCIVQKDYGINFTHVTHYTVKLEQ
jgi:hypothetical protein